MIAYSLSHWGIFLMPDDEHRRNVQFNQGGSVEPLEPGQALLVQSIIPAVRPSRKIVTFDEAVSKFGATWLQP